MITFFRKLKLSDLKFAVKYSIVVSTFLTLLLAITGLDEILEKDNTLKGYLIEIFLMCATYFVPFFILLFIMALNETDVDNSNG